MAQEDTRQEEAEAAEEAAERRAARRTAAQMAIVGVVASVLGVAAGILIDWFPASASTQADQIDTLWDVLLIASVPIFVLVTTVIGFSILNFPMRPGEEGIDGPPIHGNTRLEVIWTALPAILLVSLSTYAYSVLRANEATKAGAMTVNVTERQFAFEFSYPQSGGRQIVTPELYLPKGRPVVFK